MITLTTEFHFVLGVLLAVILLVIGDGIAVIRRSQKLDGRGDKAVKNAIKRLKHRPDLFELGETRESKAS